MLFNLAIRFPSALYVLEASRTHIRYMRIGCMQSTLWPILMTMLIWNDLMNSQHDNLSRGSPRLMTSDRQILYPHIPLAVTPLVALRLRRSRSSSSSPSRRRRRLPLVGVDVGEFCLTFEFCLTLIAFEFPWVYWLISLPLVRGWSSRPSQRCL